MPSWQIKSLWIYQKRRWKVQTECSYKHWVTQFKESSRKATKLRKAKLEGSQNRCLVQADCSLKNVWSKESVFELSTSQLININWMCIRTSKKATKKWWINSSLLTYSCIPDAQKKLRYLPWFCSRNLSVIVWSSSILTCAWRMVVLLPGMSLISNANRYSQSSHSSS